MKLGRRKALDFVSTRKRSSVTGGLERMIVFRTPFRQQPVDAYGIDHRTGKDMSADLTALFENDDGEFRVDLLEPDRRRQSRRARADDHHVEFHALAFDLAHQVLRIFALPLALPLPVAHSASIGGVKPLRKRRGVQPQYVTG